MAIDYDNVKNWSFPQVEQSYTERDVMLYALGLGLGKDPTDQHELKFLYENHDDFQVLPTLALLLAGPGFWQQDPATGINWKTSLQGEQGIRLHKSLPTSGTMLGQTRVTEIIDKGEGKGALIYTERTLHNKDNGELMATLFATSFARSDGGFGGPTGPQPKPYAIPDREPDEVIEEVTDPRAGLIYRLSGDYNPLHADPEFAKKAKFDRPILHGLATLGIASHALTKLHADFDAKRWLGIELRFSKPFTPGQTLRVESWRDGQDEEGNEVIAFRAIATETLSIVLDNGKLTLSTLK